MIDYINELRFNKQERNRIKAKINDLESRIVVESGRRHRHEVNNYRDRINRLKMRLNEISLRIVELEKIIEKTNSHSQIQVISSNGLDMPSVRDGEITITDTMVFDTGVPDIESEIIQTVTRVIERTVTYKNGKPVSKKETLRESATTRKLRSRRDLIESSIVADI